MASLQHGAGRRKGRASFVPQASDGSQLCSCLRRVASKDKAYRNHFTLLIEYNFAK
jgi:hypothetical protein